MDKDSLKEKILRQIAEKGGFSSLDLALELKEDHQTIVGAIKSLESNQIVYLEAGEFDYIEILPSGKDIITIGSPEFVLMKVLKEHRGEALEKDLIENLGEENYKIYRNQASKNKIIQIDKKSGLVKLQEEAFSAKFGEGDKQRDLLKEIEACPYQDKFDKSVLAEQQKGKNIKLTKKSYFKVSKGENFSTEVKQVIADLTLEHFKSGAWNEISYKKFNFNTKGQPAQNGAFHPLMKARHQFREILLELGFQEMPTNNFVESSFWNFDSLFQPQQHPSREAHDTFFLKNPKYGKIVDREYFEKVKEVHEVGGYGSIGWKYVWSEEEASKNILRTHTTAISAKMLYNLGMTYKKSGKFTPTKFFSIDRVFRNESLDSTHLAEFHQIEGLVADYDLGLGQLIGTIENFFHRFGIKKLRFKPAYNPYTEPSMEIFSYHEGKKKWVEVGNSGIFRPEMLLPMGLPENVNVIAWGLSLERPTMIHYQINNIRSLFGHEVSIEDTRKNQIYCLNI